MVVGQWVASRFFDFGVVGHSENVGHSEKLACKVLCHNGLLGVVGRISGCGTGGYKPIF